MARQTIFLIDGSSQMYRAFHAPIRTAEGTLLRNAKGQPTNAVYIFVTMLRKLLKEHTPQYIAASFDLPGRTFRNDLASDYKANRRPMPDDLAAQIPLVHRACEALGVPILNSEGYEADDVIGTMAMRAAAEGYDVAIVTGDKDFYQLVGDGIRVYNPKEEGTWYDAAGVKEKFGVTPEQVVDVLALMGDTIDNIKGVPGIGEKGARDLIASHGSLDRLLESAPRIPQKRYRELLQQYAEDARHSREMVRIRTDVPVEFSVDAVKFRGGSREACYELFSQLGFRSLVMEYAPTAQTTEKDYAAISSRDALDACLAELRAAGRFAIRVLADGPSAMQAAIAGIAVSSAPKRARYVPLRHTGLDAGGQLDPAATLAAFKPLIEDAAIAKVGHDLKFDCVLLERAGITPAGLETDTMLASYLLDATRSGHPLEETSLEHLGYKALTEEEVCGRGVKAIPFTHVPIAAALDYAGERADLSLQLADTLRPALVAAELDGVYRDLELPLVPVLVDLERAGIRIDGPSLAAQSQHIERELNTLAARIYELGGGEFNIGSPKQLAEVLFDRLKLPALKRNVKTKAPSTAVEVLEELALMHDMPRLILEWRALSKLKGTYVDALPQVVNPATGRVHTCFNQAVAATGRLSSSDPNLQNIPIRTELGRRIRSAFIADPGNVLISADYSQIELRVLAHMAREETLIEAFSRGEDIHDRTALKVFGPTSGLDKHELRRRAKIVNYALLYGKTAFTLAKDIGVTQQAAQEFIDAYFAGFPRVRAFIDRTLEEARQTGVVKTLFGRRRLVPELTSRNGQIRAAAERETVNMPIQGTAADILKRAMIDVHRDLVSRYGEPSSSMPRMILTVHDELLFESPKALVEEVSALVREKMGAAATLAVPLDVDVGVGDNWTAAKG